MYAYKRQGKNFQPGTKFFHYELLRKKWQIEQWEEEGEGEIGERGWGRAAECAQIKLLL